MTMNMLFVDACIRENSRTKALCEAYIRKHWTSRDMNIKELELYKEPLVPLDRERLLKRERDIAAGNFSSAEYRYAREFAEADEILIGAPYWDCSFPALLKIYLEGICHRQVRWKHTGRRYALCWGFPSCAFIRRRGWIYRGMIRGRSCSAV